MLHSQKTLLISLILLTAITITGCDTSADSEIKRAEQALNDAFEAGAELHATKDYFAAEGYLNEALELERDNRILEARTLATKAKRRAEDAKKKAEEHLRSLEKESERIK